MEDTPANVIIAQHFLNRLGHRTTHAASGRAALARLAEKRFDVVLMDVEMPGMDGLTATKLLRAGEAGELNRHVIVLAMTAHVLESFRARCAQAGMDGFLAKPVSFGTLAATLDGLDLPPTPVPASANDDAPLADLDRAAEQLGGYDDLLAEVLNMFQAELPAKRAAVAEAIEADDMPTLRLVAHTLKSTCASVGAMPASHTARRLEELAAARLETPAPPPDQELREAAAALDALLARSSKALRAAAENRFTKPA